jgi:hypothetical protein
VLEGLVAIRLKTLAAGVVLAAIALVNSGKVADQSGWAEAQGKVQSVTEQCDMKATERGVMTKTTYTATIDCDLVEAYEAYHNDKSWSVTHVFTGSLKVTSATAKATTVSLKLPRVEGRDPARGDVVALVQDPKDPANVELASSAASFPIITAGFGIVGVLLVWLGIGAPRPRRREVEDMPQMDRGAEYATRAAPAYEPQQPAYQQAQPQPAVTDYSRARTSQQVVSSPRRVFGKRGA